ncbi:MAG: Gfo/Idh/MocA family oxidoreductase [Lachnospiraceae bacterium]|nr:Gfo/Idh/MocA family oxidoreductase [Lachnospiraceae bacterium]
MKRKIVLLGLGFWGKNWMELIHTTDRAELVGVAGAPNELEEMKEKYNLSDDMLYTDFKDAIENSGAELAIVVIPGRLHFEADKLAMEKGMHVITEKPLAMDIEEAKKLLEIKAKHPGQKFMASQNYRWRPHNQAIKNAIASGMIGDVETVLVEFRKQEDLQGYRAGLEQPLLQDVCIHHFDLIRFFTGANCETIYARSYHPSWSIFEGRPGTDAIMEMENGIKVTYNGTWAARGNESSWDGNFTITGSKGALTLDANDDVYFYEFTKDEAVVMESGAEEGVLLQKPEMKYQEMAYGFNMMLDCIENDTVPETTLEDNFKSFAMVCAGLKSVETHQAEVCE